MAQLKDLTVLGSALITGKMSVKAMQSKVPIDVNSGGTGQHSIADNVYTTARYRASALFNVETNPTVNGVIYWVYE